jgi:transposase
MFMKVVGIDVSKFHFDLHLLPEGKAAHYPNDAEGIADCGRFLAEVRPERIVLEATGGYEWALTLALQTAALPVIVVNPRRVREYARSQGRLAKTDQIDARMIAEFGQSPRVQVRELPDAQGRQRREWLARKRQLVELHVAERNRLEHATDRIVTQGIGRVLKVVEKEIAKLDKKIAASIAADPTLRRKAEILDSVPGIAPATAAVLVAELPELGRVNRREIASLVGLAPMNRDSGQFRGQRTTGGGRVQVRNALYMPMLTALRCNPVIRRFYQRLVDQGKAKMTALVAAMRKLLTIFNTLIKTDQLWNPKTT